jgi:hypothetical protein
VNRADRIANLVLFALAGGAWAAVAVTFLTIDPVGNTVVLLAGALLLGVAVGLTLVPVLWLSGFAVRGKQIAYRGDWWRAARRGLLVGLAVSLLVVLRGENLLTPPIGLFVVAMAAIVELSLWFRR